jgi:NAD-dependent deacetylase
MPKNIFVLTGAGISAESGLGTFRDKKGEGIWAKFDPMKLATPEAFARDPEAVLAFYDLRRRNLLKTPSRTRRISHSPDSKARSPSAAGALRSSPRTSMTCTSERAHGASSTCMASF